ncbi:MAG: Gfo/Idh/MocA family protein [Anaerolineae bacterium]
MTERKKLRVGIIGVGGIARGQHIPGYLLCDDVELTAFCDADEDALESAGAQYGVSRLTSDYQELLADDDIDAVSICTWPNTHHPIAMAAIERGKHVYCEKPLALTYPLAREMAEAAEAAGTETAVGFTHRLTPAARLAHDLVASGALGAIYQVMAIYSVGRAGFDSRPLTPRRTRAVTGGGPLFELGPHMVDMVRWWTGKEITAVCAQNRTFVRRRRWAESGEWADVDIEDASTFLADLSGDTTAVFSHSTVITGRNFDQRVEIYGSQGALLYDQARPYELRACVGEQMVELCAGYGLYDPQWGIYRQEEPYPVIPVPRKYMDAVPGAREGKPVRSFAPYFVAAIRGEAPDILPRFEEGMKAQQVLDAVLDSGSERRWVDLDA